MWKNISVFFDNLPVSRPQKIQGKEKWNFTVPSKQAVVAMAHKQRTNVVGIIFLCNRD